MSNRLSSAMNRLSTDGQRHSIGFGRPPASPGAKRNSTLDQAEINSRFPDAAAAIAKEKADFTQKTGTEPRSNRSSAIVGERTSLVAPSINGPPDAKDTLAQPSPWGRSNTNQDTPSRPKSSSGQAPMGQFAQPPPSAGLRSGRPNALTSDSNIQSTSINVPETNQMGGMNMLSPYTGNWGSLTNTPMVPNFNHQQSPGQADLVANATAMKLAALSTVQKGGTLEDARKFRRTRSSEGRGLNSPGMPGGNNGGNNMGSNLVMTNEHGQILSAQQTAALQAQQLAALNGQRSRPVSPGLVMAGQNLQPMGMGHQNGFLSAYNATPGNLVSGMAGMNLNQFGGNMGGGDGFLGDPSEIQRGRSPRGKRGNSRPPEDPTDVELLKDIPAWLRSLRLHKYTDNLKDMRWQDLVRLDEKGLEDRGVTAKGARTKMLKVCYMLTLNLIRGMLANMSDLVGIP